MSLRPKILNFGLKVKVMLVILLVPLLLKMRFSVD